MGIIPWTKNHFKNKTNIWQISIVCLLFALFLFTRLYQLQAQMSWGYDQVQAAWASKYIIVDHKFLLLGPVAKAAGGFSVGPFYYDSISIFYWIFNMNPIASPIFATFASALTFWALYLSIKKIFNFPIAFIATFINTVVNIAADKTEWNASFIVFCSAIIFYILYKIITDKSKNHYIVWLGVALAFAFSVHFTSIFYPVLICLLLPFFPWNRKTLLYSFLCVIIIALGLSPVIYFDLTSKNSESHGIISYLIAYYHGIHLVRILQITHDAFLEFFIIFRTRYADYFDFLLVPIFVGIYLYKNINRERLLLCYMVCIWFLVPWLAFATYSGELTNYYLWITRPVALMVISYFAYRIFILPTIIPKLALAVGLIFLAYIHLTNFFNTPAGFELTRAYKNVTPVIQNKQKVNYNIHAPESYLYYYYGTYLKEK